MKARRVCRNRLPLAVWPVIALALMLRTAALGAPPANIESASHETMAVVFGPTEPASGGNPGPSSGGGQGAGARADFDSLIDLIESTIATETWAETGGGNAEIQPFPTGVMVDAAGSLELLKPNQDSALAGIRSRGEQQSGRIAESSPIAVKDDPRRESKLRFISLPRLEREIIRRQDAHQALDAAMLTLSGLQRVQYIFVYPESGDLVLAGPAGDWQVAQFGRIVSKDTGQPIVRLDDLLVLGRRGQQSNKNFFGCAINPRQEGLAKTQEYLAKTSRKPLEPSRRKAWLEKICDTLGRQDVEIFGVDPASRVARVLVEADVHMKLIGMGLADGVPGVDSYLDSVKDAGGQQAAMSVLRWWFSLRYEAIRTSPDGNAYELVGPGVCVLSENEMLAAKGQRVHTGQSDPLNQKFAESFTTQFESLAKKYPVYGDLRNIFDLSLVVALIHADKLTERVDWKPTRLGDNERLHLPQWPVPRETETVANCVAVNRRQLVAGVSGGVMIVTDEVISKPRETATSEAMVVGVRIAPPADDATSHRWWWDE